MTGKHLSYSQFELIDREFFRNYFFGGGETGTIWLLLP